MEDPGQRSPIATEPISLALLALAEEEAQEGNLKSWFDCLTALDRPFEILVLGDGRLPPESRRLETLAALCPQASVLRTDVRHGPGAALRLGLSAARYPLFGYAELSSQYQSSDLKLLLDIIDQVDLVSGQRIWPRGCGRQRFREKCFGWSVRWFFGVRLKDTNCAFKLFRRSIFKRIPIQSDGLFVHAEILAKANFLECLMTEVPVSYRPAPLPVTPVSGTSQETFAEARAVFFHPDFGPPEDGAVRSGS